MPREETSKRQAPVNCARYDGQKVYAHSLPGDQVFDLTEAFNFYDKDETGYITIPNFRNILHNFGFHRLSKREIDADLIKCDGEFMKRNCVDLGFCKHVVAYRWAAKGGREDEAKECFKVFDKKDRNVVSLQEIKTILTEYISSNLTDDDVKDFMKEVDPNNSGHIASRDFMKLYNS